MKNKIFIILILLSSNGIYAQQQNSEDSLRAIIDKQKGDTTEVNALAYLGNQQTQFDSGIIYAQQGLLLAQKLNYRKGEADCFFVIASKSVVFSESIQNGLNALSIYNDLHDNTGIASAYLVLQGTYWDAGDYKNALIHAFKGEKIAEANNVKGKFNFPGHRLAPLFLAEIGQIYVLKNQLDSALIYTQKSITQNELFNGVKWGFPVYLLATIQNMQGKYKLALENYRLSVPLSIQNDLPGDTLQIYSGVSTLFKNIGELDSAIYYAQIVERSLHRQTEPKNLLEAVGNLAQVYKLKRDKDSTLKYIELSHALKDSIYSKEKDREVQRITFNERLNQQEIVSAQIKYKSKVQLYTLLSGLFVLLLIAGILWRNNRHKQEAYALLEKQKAETDFQKLKVEHTLEELKSTQAQLIQSEKMASLGELTAGIAHEIQNPLNFVNNFSEVNKELMAEMNEEIRKGNYDDVKSIAKSITDNEEKIISHGKRADAIVKGMLQHSRTSSGQQEPTDIDRLADEYLRLAYHGFRAKDKSFDAKIETDFDTGIEKINIIPQDIGRVLLNLLNNALYAVSEKKKQYQNGYEPTVTVRTSRQNGKIEIKVKDNGNGIPQKILDKIFQPFFTTKPTGQGTGLGLSLAYDIVKAHGGEIRVETKEGEGSAFIVLLPLS
jgi:two-component system NtrC family sensor kinase